ncbi:MAG: hypothetical protein V4550_21025 [Gemmatimonadota bacterium]
MTRVNLRQGLRLYVANALSAQARQCHRRASQRFTVMIELPTVAADFSAHMFTFQLRTL